jgi:hypothetical protein
MESWREELILEGMIKLLVSEFHRNFRKAL